MRPRPHELSNCAYGALQPLAKSASSSMARSLTAQLSAFAQARRMLTTDRVDFGGARSVPDVCDTNRLMTLAAAESGP